MPRDIPDVYVNSPVVTWLRAAQARVERAWIQRNAMRQYRPGVYGYCAGGALTFDDNGRIMYVNQPAFTAANDMLQLAIVKLTRSSRIHMSIVKFNDDWGRDKADVIEAFEVAVELQIRLERGLPI